MYVRNENYTFSEMIKLKVQYSSLFAVWNMKLFKFDDDNLSEKGHCGHRV